MLNYTNYIYLYKLYHTLLINVLGNNREIRLSNDNSVIVIIIYICVKMDNEIIIISHICAQILDNYFVITSDRVLTLQNFFLIQR